VAATVFCSAKAQFWMISEAILIPKIYARLQEIASNFSKFSGGGPQTPRRCSSLRRSVRGFAPLPGPPFQNCLIRPCVWLNGNAFWSGASCVIFHSVVTANKQSSQPLNMDLELAYNNIDTKILTLKWLRQIKSRTKPQNSNYNIIDNIDDNETSSRF